MRSADAARNAEMLGLMVNEPNIKPQELRQITAPTLVICGTRDMIKQEHTELIANSLPNATLKIIEGTHFIANRNPAEFNRAVEEFLETV